MIYQLVDEEVRFSPSIDIFPDLKPKPGWQFQKRQIVTHVNRQIRQESIPVLFDGLVITIGTDYGEDMSHFRRWLDWVDEGLVNAISRLCVTPFRLCSCDMDIKLKGPIQSDPVTTYQCLVCQEASSEERDRLGPYGKIVRSQVLNLETKGEDRRTMTKAALHSLVELFSTTP